MCIKNNKFIRGYVSQLKSNTSTDKANISLQELKDYVDNVPLAQFITSTILINSNKSPSRREVIPEKQSRIKRERNQVGQLEVEVLENFEPEINIHESDTKIEIVENPIIVNEKTKNNNNNNIKGAKPEFHPLTQNNDFQEKSSTQTLDLLKNLVHGTQSAAVDKLRELITKPISEESNDDFLFQEKENEQAVNNFEAIFVKPEPSDDLEPEEHNISGGESEDIAPIPEEIQSLLNRHDKYCPICRKTFLCKSYYERHITMHTGIKNYQCEICLKRFTRKSTLKTHFMVHTGDASFTCPLCHKIFTQKGNMKSHMQTHYSVKNFRCYECGKNFSLKSNLKTHLALHEKGKRQQCPICRKLIAKNYFAAHLNMHQEFRKIT